MHSDTSISLTPGQKYQFPGGQCQGVVSVTEDDGQFDWVLVLQPEDGGQQVVMMASAFTALKPKLVH